jgi:hypothetical protein
VKVLSGLISGIQRQCIQAALATLQSPSPCVDKTRSIMVAPAKTIEPTVVNGINVDDLFALIQGVKLNIT